MPRLDFSCGASDSPRQPPSGGATRNNGSQRPLSRTSLFGNSSSGVGRNLMDRLQQQDGADQIQQQRRLASHAGLSAGKALGSSAAAEMQSPSSMPLGAKIATSDVPESSPISVLFCPQTPSSAASPEFRFGANPSPELLSPMRMPPFHQLLPSPLSQSFSLADTPTQAPASAPTTAEPTPATLATVATFPPSQMQSPLPSPSSSASAMDISSVPSLQMPSASAHAHVAGEESLPQLAEAGAGVGRGADQIDADRAVLDGAADAGGSEKCFLRPALPPLNIDACSRGGKVRRGHLPPIPLPRNPSYSKEYRLGRSGSGRSSGAFEDLLLAASAASPSAHPSPPAFAAHPAPSGSSGGWHWQSLSQEMRSAQHAWSLEGSGVAEEGGWSAQQAEWMVGGDDEGLGSAESLQLMRQWEAEVEGLPLTVGGTVMMGMGGAMGGAIGGGMEGEEEEEPGSPSTPSMAPRSTDLECPDAPNSRVRGEMCRTSSLHDTKLLMTTQLKRSHSIFLFDRHFEFPTPFHSDRPPSCTLSPSAPPHPTASCLTLPVSALAPGPFPKLSPSPVPSPLTFLIPPTPPHLPPPPSPPPFPPPFPPPILSLSPRAQVYEARDRKGGARCAVKVSKRQFRSKGERERYMHEIESVANVPEHAHIVRYYRGWQQDSHFYLQMELCEGGSLRALLDSLPQPLPEDQVWRFVRQVASGLDHIHSRGVLHLDIKPDNIFIDAHGNLKIGDFGRAVWEQRWDWEEGDGGYLAPELLQDEPPTTATDMYSFGAMLFELVFATRLPRSGLPPSACPSPCGAPSPFSAHGAPSPYGMPSPYSPSPYCVAFSSAAPSPVASAPCRANPSFPPPRSTSRGAGSPAKGGGSPLKGLGTRGGMGGSPVKPMGGSGSSPVKGGGDGVGSPAERGTGGSPCKSMGRRGSGGLAGAVAGAAGGGSGKDWSAAAAAAAAAVAAADAAVGAGCGRSEHLRELVFALLHGDAQERLQAHEVVTIADAVLRGEVDLGQGCMHKAREGAEQCGEEQQHVEQMQGGSEREGQCEEVNCDDSGAAMALD
ncbi:unnamed protein product [Closterium sp. NIES-65]|nr:unnamed protein product [Closterium sp. NIES-65]